MKYVNAEKATVEKWGFRIDYFFGNCTGTFDYKEDGFKILNEKSTLEFVEKFGKNWMQRFYNEVESLLKTEK